ncbi:TerC/Alx family metal homeostasis membrane protein [Candidatus Nanopelagicales bacterium]|nr:TerC/Alx family metal homeostasis membrane protein [Candidatus Nanopelagicales bacterium]
MDTSLTVWALTIGAILVLVLIDFFTVSRKPHDVMFREAMLWSIFYIGVAIAFGLFVWQWAGSDFGTQYFTAYLVEKSLSVDNIFVFIIILTQFKTPSVLHQRVLLFGVMLALLFRAIFIAIGAAAISLFAFTFVLFGALLLWTGVQLMRHRNEDPDPMDNIIIRNVRKRVRFSDEYDGTKLFTRINGARVATPLLLVMVAIGGTDLLFALDSIPATFGVTQEPYLVFAANAFALLGLRALYFLVKGLLDKLVYLSTGLAVILIFIGFKLILTYFHEVFPETVPKIETVWSLVFIGVVLVIVTIASWIKTRRDPEAIAHAGRLTDPREDREQDSSQ